MNNEEKRKKEDLAETNALVQLSLEEQISGLHAALRRWRFSVLYIAAAVTCGVLLQLYLILKR